VDWDTLRQSMFQSLLAAQRRCRTGLISPAIAGAFFQAVRQIGDRVGKVPWAIRHATLCAPTSDAWYAEVNAGASSGLVYAGPRTEIHWADGGLQVERVSGATARESTNALSFTGGTHEANGSIDIGFVCGGGITLEELEDVIRCLPGKTLTTLGVTPDRRIEIRILLYF
jgi:hypothetical protein